ncbi:MAG TPA: response regulator [Chitinophagaceae bacterium]|jgi:CheY-like chemotaxis protein|nr:response regulator [Chitinophagaceae bacterium]
MNKARKILIVDDDSDDQVLLMEALHELDSSIRFQTATNGHHALELLNNNLHDLPNLIFLDLNMPRMNGVQFLHDIKKRQELRDLPVIIYSTSSDQKDIAETARLGAEHFITKPTGLSELKTRLKSVLSHEWAH